MPEIGHLNLVRVVPRHEKKKSGRANSAGFPNEASAILMPHFSRSIQILRWPEGEQKQQRSRQRHARRPKEKLTVIDHPIRRQAALQRNEYPFCGQVSQA